MLRGENVYLRALEPADLDLLYKWENDVTEWGVTDTLVPFSKHMLAEYIANQGDIYTAKQLRLIVCTGLDDTPVGTIDLFDFDPQHGRAGVGILIADKADRGKGAASEALRLLTDYTFSILGLHQMYCNILHSNTASLALFEGRGFVKIGTKKDWRRTENGWEDEFLLQLLKG